MRIGTWTTAGMTAACLAWATLVAAQSIGALPPQTPPDEVPPPQETDPTSPDEKTDEPKTDETPPSLDDLLGIKDETKENAEAVAAREADEELKRRLAEEEIGDAFEVAIQKMTIVADQLDQQFDTGVGTQRLQEDILRKLEFLLEQSKSMKSSSSSSSSSSARQPEPAQDPGKQRQEQPKEQQQSQQDSEAQGADGRGAPGRQDGDINTMLDEARSEWGNLPERVRDMLLQGRREKFSSLYEQLTREYYRRLAEEGSP